MSACQFPFACLVSLFFLSVLGGGACTKRPTATSDEAKVEAARRSLRYARSADPKTLDPQGQFDQGSALIIQNTFDTLVSYHYLKRPYELIPLLLASMPELSATGTEYSFTLRQGVYFHDDLCFPKGEGRELTSDDILYTIRRFADSRVNRLSWFLLDGLIPGLDEFRTQTKVPGASLGGIPIEGLVKIDRYRFKISLKQKNPLFLYALAASSLSIVPHEAIEHYGADFGQHPVGTGPFRLVKYKKKQLMHLVKNPRYFMQYPSEGEPGDEARGLLKDAGRSLPILDELAIDFIPELQPAVLEFKKGSLAWVGLDRDNFAQLAYQDASGAFQLRDEYRNSFVLYTEPGLSTYYYAFNMQDPVLGKNKKLRQAINYGIDIEAKIRLLKNGRGLKLHTVTPHPIAGSEKDLGRLWYEFNPSQAKRLLAEAGYPNGTGLGEAGLEITLSGTSSQHKQEFEFVRDGLAQLGITVTADYKTWSSYLKALDQGDYQIALSAWGADYPDAENFYQLFYGRNIPGSNHTRFDHPGYNSLYEKIRFMENGPERYRLLTEMMQILREEAPVVLDNNQLGSGLVQNWLSNFKRHMMLDAPFVYLGLAEPKKPAL